MPMVRNCEALNYWLLYAQKALRVSSLLGSNDDEILSKAESYALTQSDCSYSVEMPLQGPAGMDLSVQYCAADFFAGSHFLSAEAGAYNTLFSAYAGILAKDNPQILPLAMLYLEADTFSGDDRKAGVFFNLAGAFVKPVLPQVLRLQDLSCYEEPVLRIMEKAASVLQPWQFGFMYARRNFSVRLVCYLTDGSWHKLPEILRKLGYEAIPEDDLQELATFVKSDDVGVFVNLDVMPDGKIGAIFGLELSSVPTKIFAQRQWIVSEAIQRFMSLLKRWDVADERAAMIERCIFHVEFQPPNAPAFHVTSGFSHFKLRWQKGRRLPAKVYLQIKKDGVFSS